MKQPEVSIVIPTFNRVHLLKRSVTSVLQQTYEDLELIIVDDGSTDNTAEMVTSLRDSRIKYLNLGTNRGAPFARNVGVRQALGRLIAFQDSDDEWAKEKLEKQVRVMNASGNDVGLVYTGYWAINDGKKTYLPSPSIHPKNGDLHSVLMSGNFVAAPTALLRAECFEKVGLFDERLLRLQEWELWLRVSRHYLFRFIDEPLVTAHFQPQGITADENRFVGAFELILEKHSDDFRKNPKALALLYFSVGTHLLYSNPSPSKEKAYLIEALRLDPTGARYYLYALIALLGKDNFNRIRSFYRRIRGFLKST